MQGAEPDLTLVAQFDGDRNTRLERAGRDSARASLAANPVLRQPMREQLLPATGTSGPRVSPSDVQRCATSVDLYAPGALRALVLTFAHDDWEQDLSAFWHTDVELPATLEGLLARLQAASVPALFIKGGGTGWDLSRCSWRSRQPTA